MKLRSFKQPQCVLRQLVNLTFANRIFGLLAPKVLVSRHARKVLVIGPFIIELGFQGFVMAVLVLVLLRMLRGRGEVLQSLEGILVFAG